MRPGERKKVSTGESADLQIGPFGGRGGPGKGERKDDSTAKKGHQESKRH